MQTSLRRIVYASAAALCLTCFMGGVAAAQGKGRGDGGVPPGLAKKGGLPPGQAKKYRPDDGVIVLRDVFSTHGYRVIRTANDGESRVVYYRLRDGSLRRAIVRPGADQLIFVNVPNLLLREVLGRLY